MYQRNTLVDTKLEATLVFSCELFYWFDFQYITQ
jgi:hypothetical protein